MSEDVDKAQAFLDERLEQLSEEDRIIFAACVRHLNNGANWGFDTDLQPIDRDFKHLRKVLEGMPALQVWNLNRGAVVEIKDPVRANQIIQKIVGSENWNPGVYAQAREKNLLALKKFIDAGEEGLVGFYCTNDTNTITIDGKTHRAFALNVKDFIGYVASAGYWVKTGTGTVAPATAVMEGAVGFMAQLDKAPSSNAALVELMKAKR